MKGERLEGEDEGDDRCGEERGVEAVKETTATRDNVAAIFDADGTFKETLHQVAQRAGNGEDSRERQPFPHGQVGDKDREDVSSQEGEDETANESFPSLARADTRDHLVLADE